VTGWGCGGSEIVSRGSMYMYGRGIGVSKAEGAKRRDQKGGVKGKGDGDGDNGEAEAEVDR
jgi:hypothetical protein